MDYAFPAPSPVFETRFGTFARGFGDYERRRATGATAIEYPTGPAELDLHVKSRTKTWGMVAGVDVTTRSLGTFGDGLIVGALSGHLSSDLDLNAASFSRDPTKVGNGFSNLKANLSGPSAGAFATYFNGGFSTDATFKVDFLHLDQSFSEELAFTNASGTVPNSGRASTYLTVATVAGNLNYRFPLQEGLWIEPTVGVQYTSTNYAASAVFLGLDDGYVLRVQGGARLGMEVYRTDQVRMMATLTGLAYSNVDISGGFIAGAGFGTDNLLAQADERKLRGQGILGLDFDFGNGVSSFVQGDVRGGEDLIGYGGRAGFRIQW